MKLFNLTRKHSVVESSSHQCKVTRKLLATFGLDLWRNKTTMIGRALCLSSILFVSIRTDSNFSKIVRAPESFKIPFISRQFRGIPFFDPAVNMFLSKHERASELPSSSQKSYAMKQRHSTKVFAGCSVLELVNFFASKFKSK